MRRGRDIQIPTNGESEVTEMCSLSFEEELTKSTYLSSNGFALALGLLWALTGQCTPYTVSPRNLVAQRSTREGGVDRHCHTRAARALGV